MTREQWAERLPVIQAWCDGKEVDYRTAGSDEEWSFDPSPYFGDDNWEFRIKPETRRVWINCYTYGTSEYYASKEAADQGARPSRIACHEIELPPLP